jgi:hypothetical protein
MMKGLELVPVPKVNAVFRNVDGHRRPRSAIGFIFSQGRFVHIQKIIGQGERSANRGTAVYIAILENSIMWRIETGSWM